MLQFTTDDLGLFVYACITPIVLIVGLVGNSLCLLVFRVKRLRSTPTGSSCAIILSALSAVDLLVLLCYVAPEWIHKGLPVLIRVFSTPPRLGDNIVKCNPDFVANSESVPHCDLTLTNYSLEPMFNTTHFSLPTQLVAVDDRTWFKLTQFLYRPGLFQLYLLITYVLRMMSAWLLVLFTIERYIGVCYPLKTSLFRTRHKVNRVILLLFFIALLICSYKPILISIFDNTYSLTNVKPDDLSTKDMDLAGYEEQPPGTSHNFPHFSLKADLSFPVVNHSQSTFETHEKPLVAFILDSCYAVLLTVLPFLIIFSLNLGIVAQLLRPNAVLLQNTHSLRNSIHRTARETEQKDDCTCCRNREHSFVRKEVKNHRPGVCDVCSLLLYTSTDPKQPPEFCQWSPTEEATTSRSNDQYQPVTNHHVYDQEHMHRQSGRNLTRRAKEHLHNSFVCSCCKSNSQASKPNRTEWPSRASRSGDRLGRQFTTTLLTISACFLLLNIPYLIVWICRWQQPRMYKLYMVRNYVGNNSCAPTSVCSHSRDKDVLNHSTTLSFVWSIDPNNNDNKSHGLSVPIRANATQTLQEPDQLDWLQAVLFISRTIFSFNYCINFFLYSLVGKYFRRELTRLFWGWKYSLFVHVCPARAHRLARNRQRRVGLGQDGLRLRLWQKRAGRGPHDDKTGDVVKMTNQKNNPGHLSSLPWTPCIYACNVSKHPQICRGVSYANCGCPYFARHLPVHKN
ncbi:hypothetical protein EG68_02873 [Paragonimus skrjabini miyazakii]|uniref:G-protein coupled receptors family 1 profile domain-containing protein n=1 Tax=Paragonimus skrjabini miyazakii TaxID=59628 RepID=A0A8S9YWX6_9TREM|nr:hypothetical protein EG68_02873 [Paragonimus skrjabini miyazakii]